jgi:hypothetical protein
MINKYVAIGMEIVRENGNAWRKQMFTTNPT